MNIFMRFTTLTFLALAASSGFLSISSAMGSSDNSPFSRPEPLETPFMSEVDYDDMEDNGLVLPQPTPEEKLNARRGCMRTLCEGDRVRVIQGSLRGFTGLVVQMNGERQKLRLLTSTGIRAELASDSVRPLSLKADCHAAFCRGDKVKIAGLWNKGSHGYIVNFDRSSERVQIRRSHSAPMIESHIVFLRHAKF